MSDTTAHSAGGASDCLVGEPLWELAQRVVQSRGFARSRLLTRFLLYICERQLRGEHELLSEQHIGERVFERPAGYRPSDDNIVRNYARLLRLRLDDFFVKEGRDEPLRLVVPRGRYIPSLVDRDEACSRWPSATLPAPENQPSAGTAPDPQAHPGEPPLAPPEPSGCEVAPARATPSRPEIAPGLWRQWQGRIAWGLVAGLSLLLLLVGWRLHTAASATRLTATSDFWGAFFSPARDTLVIPGDDGLVIYQDLTHHQVSLGQYASGEYRGVDTTPSTLGNAAALLASRRYTSFVDLQIVSQVAQLPEARGSRMKIRYAREVSLDDLKQANVILIGSLHANPWTELYQKKLNFQFQNEEGDSDLAIHNLQPQAGEQATYTTGTDQARTTYGVIAVLPNLDGSGHVLLIEGINMAGTEAAAELLLDGRSGDLLAKLPLGGVPLRSFEVLVKTSNFGANAPHAEIVATRLGHDALAAQALTP